MTGTNYVFFSSTTAGGYQLYVGDVTTGQRWSLSQFGVNADTTKAKLGSSYYGGPAAAQPTLLSQGRPAAASASYNASLTADKAFDGNTTSTRWDSPEGAGVDPQWISVDLGATKTISSIDLYWDAGALVYQIQTSNDNANWTTIYSTNNGVSYGHVTLPNLNGHGRYVRMLGTKRATPWGIRSTKCRCGDRKRKEKATFEVAFSSSAAGSRMQHVHRKRGLALVAPCASGATCLRRSRVGATPNASR